MRIKKPLILAAICLLALPAAAQDDARRKEAGNSLPTVNFKEGRTGRNALFFTANFERSSYNTNGMAFGVDYGRHLGTNTWFTIGARWADFTDRRKSYSGYDANPVGYNPYINTVYYTTYQFAVKVLWDILVAGDWLFFRAGGGAGGMYNDIDRMENMSSQPGSEVRPFFMAEANWVVKLWGGGVYLRFSPLVWGPSHFQVALVGLGRPAHKGLYHYDMGHFAVGMKF